MKLRYFVKSLSTFVALALMGHCSLAAEQGANNTEWKVGTPIVTYFAGPAMSEAVAKQMAEGGFNVVWCKEGDLDLLAKHHLRGMLHDGLISPQTLESVEKTKQLDALIERVKGHRAFYSYYIIDEPSANTFTGLGKLTAHLRGRDPAHMPYINLFPTYANNEQLGTKGNTVDAYREYLRQYVDMVRPALLSYDNYQFMKGHDEKQYFLNLNLMRAKSQEAGIPFLNIVQAASWSPGVRVPGADEMRYLVYTTIAYGAQGISYYVYQAANHEGGMIHADGTPTEIYYAVKPLNRQFVKIVSELQPLRSLAVYHTAMKEAGCVPLAADAPIGVDAAKSKLTERGLLLAYFGKGDRPNHVLVVNMDYKTAATASLKGPGEFERFDADGGTWAGMKTDQPAVELAPGGGVLLRIAQ